MRVVCLSDTHTYHDQVKVPDGDILIHAGDFTYDGRPADVFAFLKWLSGQPHRHKIFIAGNHDVLFEKNPELMMSMVKDVVEEHPEVIYLQDQEATVEGLRIYGSPWQPFFQNWAFNIPRGQLWTKWKDIPDGLDILVTHGPPSGDLGGVLPKFKEEVGDPELLERIQQARPRLHVCGHIHCGHGRRERFGIIFVNAAICDEAYDPVESPIVVDLPPRR